MSNDKWTKEMRRRLANDEAKVPDDLWSRIEEGLNECTPQHPAIRKHATRFIVWATAAAAAIATLLIVVTPAPNVTENRGASNSMSISNDMAYTLMPHSATPIKQTYGNAVAHNIKTDDIACVPPEEKNISRETPKTDNVSNSDTTTSKKEDVSATTSVAKQTKNQHRQSTTTHEGSCLLASATSVDKPHSGNRWTLQAHASGGIVETRNSQQSGRPMLMASNKDNALCTSSYSALLTRYNEVKHHSQPMSYGISVGYALNRRLSLATGVVYTYASSDFSASSGNDNIVTTQRLHYIGVPISVRYKLWGIRLVQLYASIGGQADFNIAASTTSNGVTADAAKDRVLFSTNAAAGVQLNVLPQLGVYAEPGVRYYFNNHSKVETIFKEKPCNFNLQVGIRLDL